MNFSKNQLEYKQLIQQHLSQLEKATLFILKMVLMFNNNFERLDLSLIKIVSYIAQMYVFSSIK